MNKEKSYNLSIRCYYEENWTNHRQELKLSELKKWIESYIFTHPQVTGFSIRLYRNEESEKNENL